MFATCSQTNLAAQMVVNGPVILSGKGFAPVFLLAELPRAVSAGQLLKATFCALELAHFSVLLRDADLFKNIKRGSAYVSQGLQEYLLRHPEYSTREEVLAAMREASRIVQDLMTCLLTCAIEAGRHGITAFVVDCLEKWKRSGFKENECIVTAVHVLFSVRRIQEKESLAPAASALQEFEARAYVEGWKRTTMVQTAPATNLLHVR